MQLQTAFNIQYNSIQFNTIQIPQRKIFRTEFLIFSQKKNCKRTYGLGFFAGINFHGFKKLNILWEQEHPKN